MHVPHSPAVAAPTVSIMASGSAPLYAGTSFSLTCDFTLSPSVDTSPATAVSWRVSGTAVDTSPDRITASGDSLSFSPLATSDSGSYTCEVTVTAQEHTTVEGLSQSAAVEVTVASNECCLHLSPSVGQQLIFLSPTVPPPDVTVSANRTAPLYAGTGLTLTCTVSLDSSVDTDVSVSVTWTGPKTIPGERHSVMEASGSGGTYTGSLTISPLAEGQNDGQYTYSVAVSGGSSVLEATNSDSTTIDVMGKNELVIEYIFCTGE